LSQLLKYQNRQLAKLSSKDKELIKTFRTLCNIDKRKEFSSDTFRMYQLDRFLCDTQHGIGGFFAKLLKNGLIQKVGSTRSQIKANHLRMIFVYEWIEEEA